MKEEMKRKHFPLLQLVQKSHKELLHVDPKLKQSKKTNKKTTQAKM